MHFYFFFFFFFKSSKVPRKKNSFCFSFMRHSFILTAAASIRQTMAQWLHGGCGGGFGGGGGGCSGCCATAVEAVAWVVVAGVVATVAVEAVAAAAVVVVGHGASQQFKLTAFYYFISVHPYTSGRPQISFHIIALFLASLHFFHIFSPYYVLSLL